MPRKSSKVVRGGCPHCEYLVKILPVDFVASQEAQQTPLPPTQELTPLDQHYPEPESESEPEPSSDEDTKNKSGGKKRAKKYRKKKSSSKKSKKSKKRSRR